MDVSQIEVIDKYADIFQVGARNMQNFTLLRELGHARKPVLLKRGISATIEEWLLSAEYMLSGGNTDVILCERGIRTFETATRNTFDISAIPVVQEAEPPADHRRSEPRRRTPRHGRADGARGGRRRRRRPDHRGALRSGSRAERRRAVDVPGAVRSADGGAADHRAGDRPQHLPRAGRAARLGLVMRLASGRSAASAMPMVICLVIQPGAASDRRRPRQPPIFEKIGIVGLGLIGGSIALAARQLWPTSLVIGVDNKDVLETAMRLHAIDVAADDLIVLAEADLVDPRGAGAGRTSRCSRELDENVRQPAVVTDTGSTKRAIVEAARGAAAAVHVRRRPSARRRRAGRPRARAARSVQRPSVAADAGRRRRPATALEKLSAFVAALGAEPRMRRRRGARSAARVSQPSAAADGERADAGRRRRGRRRTGWRSPAADSPTRRGWRRARADIWRDIAATNADEIGPALDALIARLQDLRRDLPGGGFSGISGHDNVAHFAHLGGLLTGLIIMLYWKNKDRNRRNDYFDQG